MLSNKLRAAGWLVALSMLGVAPADGQVAVGLDAGLHTHYVWGGIHFTGDSVAQQDFWPAYAEETARTESSDSSETPLEVLVNWGGARPWLERLGITFEGMFTGDVSRVGSNGTTSRVTARSLTDLAFTFDLERMAGLTGVTLFVEFFAQRGPNGSDYVGDMQGFSNIDADNLARFAEVWAEALFLSDRVRLKVGRVDGNSEFAAVEAAGDFINSSAGFSPTILDLPTYPDPALSANLFLDLGGGVQLGAGLYDGAGGGPSNALFGVGKLDFTWSTGSEESSGRFGVGYWYHTGDHDRFDGTVKQGSAGLFALLEQRVRQDVALFLQFGSADRAVSEILYHASAGAFWDGPIEGRDDDAVGLMVSAVGLNGAPGADYLRNETVLELFYRYQPTPYLSLKPDLQYIVNPSGNRAHPLVATVRFEMAF